jgi:NAD-dependent dihydropyrimidine dehydrogenase PreA subunit
MRSNTNKNPVSLKQAMVIYVEDRVDMMLEGLDRKDVHWNPTINKDLCQNCGICVDFCKHGVYQMVNDNVSVRNPTECVVLCNNCLPQCPTQAISFPDKVQFLKELRALRKKNS